MRAKCRGSGFTLIELLISMAVMAVLVAMAAPSMYEFIMRKRVEGAADELLADLRLARSLQVRNNRDTTIKFSHTSSETCYVIYHRNALIGCDCASTPVCPSSLLGTATELKTVRLPASNNVTISPASGTPVSLELDAITGLPSGGVSLQISIAAPSGGEARLTTSATGRPQLCSVSGHTTAYPACPTS